jgi:WD40 repeat protein/tetratricopeptide (TPR) repeat protein
VSYSPDGARLATAGGVWYEPGEIKVWDARSGAEIATLRGHTGGVSSVAYSPDGTRLATASLVKRTVKVWDARSGAELLTLCGHAGLVQSICYSPDGSRLACASGSVAVGGTPGEVKVWDARSGAEVLTLRGHAYIVASVCFSPDGSRLASASWDKTVKVWDARSGAEALTLRGHTDQVLSVSYSPDGTRLATASDDRTVKVWDARSGAEITTLRGHTDQVLSVSYSPDGTRLATASLEAVKVWDARSRTEALSLRGHTSEVTAVAYSPDGSRLASASGDRTVKIWEARSGTELLALRGHPDWVNSICYSPNGAHLATASYDGTVKVWDARSGAELLTLRGHAGKFSFVYYSADGSRLTSIGSNPPSGSGEVKVWDARSGQLLPAEKAPRLPPGRNTSPDGLRVAVPKGDTIHIFPCLSVPGTYDPWAEDADRRTAMAPAWHTQDAEDAEQKGDWFAAVFHRRWLTRLRPDDPLERVRLARACARLGRMQEALDLCERLLAERPGLAPAYLERARLRLAAGLKRAADMDVQAGLALASRSRVGWPNFAADKVRAGETAAQQKDWVGVRKQFALAVLWQASEPEHRRRLAWAELAGGDAQACRSTLRRLYQDCRGRADLQPLFVLSASLASGLHATPTAGAGAWPAAVDVALQKEEARRAAVIVRAAALLPGAVQPAELLTLARQATQTDPESWQARELLGAALYRAGKPEDAVGELDEAMRLHGSGGSTWANFFLALAHRQLGHADKAQEYRQQAQRDATWEDGVIHRQLSSELDAAR